jgi:hypothetical protein
VVYDVLLQVDRARAVLKHGSQFADPRRDTNYWKYWKEFEEAHGNEDTFRDMLRIQRSVITANSQVLDTAAVWFNLSLYVNAVSLSGQLSSG